MSVIKHKNIQNQIHQQPIKNDQIETQANKLIDLAEAINLTGGKPYPEAFREILSRYAQGLITYDEAMNQIKKVFERHSNGI